MTRGRRAPDKAQPRGKSRTLHELWSGPMVVARPEAGSPLSPAGGDSANTHGLGGVSTPDPQCPAETAAAVKAPTPTAGDGLGWCLGPRKRPSQS